MKPAPFTYSRPADWPAAVALLGGGARPMAGGQSIGPMLNLRMAQPEGVIDLRHLPDARGVTVSGGRCRIAAGTTHAAIEDGAVPGRLGAILAGVARRIAYRPVRNRGTVGGSLAHADPAADWVAVLPAFPGDAVAVGPAGERRIPLASFVTGLLSSALRPDELLRAIELPVLPEGTRWGHWKFCRKPGEFSKATACVLAVPGEAPRAVLAALDEPPMLIPDATALIAAPEEEASRIVAALPGLDPWRAALARTALRRAVRMAGEDA
ncbi:FAD binding domain-containing protein [Pararoseomonas indoligenes]|uniref:FAD binding domain-containing protein n=1 Tax=Roseomonas indoligenes TaxID=2820811 RepID=A0A940MXM1_9PROT|nr:FAD binding domain-containing protein [Pararoseomonas indoligenes]MBP0496143.1 FAD binding domain-containing protein [Pararoseomonas indoligenes]